MNWEEKLQKIIDHIEHHLQRKEEPVDTEKISEIAGCSFSFFQKVFSYMNGISLSEYIRFRKMTLAGYDLKSTDMKILEISCKYGYESPTSFTRAFQQFHGITPTEAKNKNARLQVYPKMQTSSKHSFCWRSEKKSAFRLIGKSVRVSGSPEKAIPEFWSQCQRDGVYSRLISMDSGNPKGTFGLCRICDDLSGLMDYSIMVTSEQPLPPGFHELVIPETEWAVFDCIGPVPGAVQAGWRYLNDEWLDAYPFRHAGCPELEWYSSGNPYDTHYLSQIWIPIITES
nr:AraC family transcriptional regulator [uncultured Anaerostipes sp.]